MSGAPMPALPPADLDHAFHAVGEAGWSALRGGRVFLTGGTGFVGKWLMATLLEAGRRLDLGCELVVLSRDPEAFCASAPTLARAQGVTLMRGDVRDFAFPAGRFTHVVHAATDVVAFNSPLATFSTCVDGTRRAIDLALQSGARDFLLVSSGAVYGRQPPQLERLDESYPGAPDPLTPSSAYGEGKRVSEWLCAAQGVASGTRFKVARCFAFVGPCLPLDKHFAVGNFLRDAMADGQITIQGDGTPYRTYLHAADMAAWLWATLLRGQAGRAYNVGGHEAVSIAELARRTVSAVGSSASVAVLKAAEPGKPAERYVPDVSRAQRELALPDPIPLDDAIARTARWHRDSTSST